MEEARVSLKETYDRDFYHGQSKGSVRAAQLILPYVLQAVGSPRTVLDIGCGVGTWLRVLQDLIPDVKILGVDHPDVPQDLLMISKDEFVGRDLRKEIDLGSLPIRLTPTDTICRTSRLRYLPRAIIPPSIRQLTFGRKPACQKHS